jgi:rhodanese-related sulfurtransferase
MYKQLIHTTAALVLLGFFLPAAADEFPHRTNYPDLETISTDQLAARLSSVHVVDVRSRYEFDTIHISGAHNIPVASASFTQELKQLQAGNNKPIVTYCNGHTCEKSYKAARKATENGVKNILVYDAGIFEFAKKQGDKAALLGRSPVNAADLISKDKLNAHMLTPEKFQKQADRADIQVLDVRSRLQRSGAGLFVFNERHADMEDRQKMAEMIDRAKREKKTVLAYDQVGKQVQWLQYEFERRGLKNYFFMKGGAEAYLELLARQQKGAVESPSDVAKN